MRVGARKEGRKAEEGGREGRNEERVHEIVKAWKHSKLQKWTTEIEYRSQGEMQKIE